MVTLGTKRPFFLGELRTFAPLRDQLLFTIQIFRVKFYKTLWFLCVSVSLWPNVVTLP